MQAVTKANVRKGPDVSAELLGKLEEGEKIFAVELTEEGWYRVVFQGETGYIRQDLLTVYGGQGGEETDDDEESQQWMAGAQMPEDVWQDMTGNGENEQVNHAEDVQAEGETPNPEDGDIEEQTQENAEEKGKGENFSTFVILAAVVLIILIYGAMQIVKEKKETE